MVACKIERKAVELQVQRSLDSSLSLQYTPKLLAGGLQPPFRPLCTTPSTGPNASSVLVALLIVLHAVSHLIAVQRCYAMDRHAIC